MFRLNQAFHRFLLLCGQPVASIWASTRRFQLCNTSLVRGKHPEYKLDVELVCSMLTLNCLNETAYGRLRIPDLCFCVQGFKRQGCECFDNLFRKEAALSKSGMTGD